MIYGMAEYMEKLTKKMAAKVGLTRPDGPEDDDEEPAPAQPKINVVAYQPHKTG